MGELYQGVLRRRNAAGKMKRGTVVGRISVEAWRSSAERAVTCSTRLVNKIWDGESVPEELKKEVCYEQFSRTKVMCRALTTTADLCCLVAHRRYGKDFWQRDYEKLFGFT